ncbi:MAG: hypothetical protein ABIS38_05315 [Sphingomicrobium sp.]
MDVEVEKPHLPHPTGHRHIDFVLPISALFISFVSIAIAWHHGQVMQELVHQNERLVEANSLPYLQVSGNMIDHRLLLQAANEGVGPAKIMSAEIRVDGRPVQSLDALIDACCGKGDYADLYSSSLEGRMVRPGDNVAFVDFRETPANRPQLLALNAARRAGRIQTRLCYCSVFNDCWQARSDDATPNAVSQCVAPERPYMDRP